jgi:hypothetical protein
MDAMAYFLFKSEPGVYSFEDLVRDRETVWDDVTNPAAVKNLREMKAGTKWIFYHTGDERTAVGTGTVVSVDSSDPKVPIVRVKAGKRLSHPSRHRLIDPVTVAGFLLWLRASSHGFILHIRPCQCKGASSGEKTPAIDLGLEGSIDCRLHRILLKLRWTRPDSRPVRPAYRRCRGVEGS